MLKTNTAIRKPPFGGILLVVAYLLKGGKNPVAMGILFALVFAVLVFRNSEKIPLPRRSALIFFVLFLVWPLLSLASHPPLWTFFLAYSKILFYIGFFLATVSFHHGKDYDVLHSSVILVSFIESLVLIYTQVSQHSPAGYLSGNPTYSGLLISAGICIAITKYIESKSSQEKSIFVCAIAVMLIGLYFLKSRSSVLGLVLASYWVLPRDLWKKCILVICSLMMWMFYFHSQQLFDYFKLDPYAPELGRLIIWKTALAALRAHPILGWGMGNFESAYMAHQLPSAGILRFEKTTAIAHNDLLQLAVTAGLPTLFLFFAGLSQMKLRPRVGWAMAIVMTTVAGSMFNFAFFLPINGLLFCLALSALFSPSGNEEKNLHVRSIIINAYRILLALFVITFLTMPWLPIRSDIWNEKAGKLMANKDWEAAERALLNSIKWAPGDPFVWSRLARLQTRSELNRPPEMVISSYQKTIELAPSHAPFWMDLGFYQLSRHNLTAADVCFEEALRLEPRAPLSFFAMGLVLSEEGKKAEARQFFQLAESLAQTPHNEHKESGYASYMLHIPRIPSEN